MITTIADQLQGRLQDGSCLLISGQQTTAPAALASGPAATAATAINKTALMSAPTATAINKTALTSTALTSGTTTLKTGTGVGAALGAGTIAGTILGIVVIGLVAYVLNKAVRVFIK